MNVDRESILRPLRSAAPELGALRTGDGPARARAVVRIAQAAETSLRRLLRDDPTAPVELRLRALSPDDLSADQLLGELRQRDRIPMELAAGFHELTAAARRIAAGDEPTARDGEVALVVVDGLDRHLADRHVPPPLQDPVVTREDTLLHPDPGEEPARAVPAAGRRPWGLIAAAAVVLALVVTGVLWFTTLGRDRGLAEGEALYRQGSTAQAEARFRQYADRHPGEGLPHLYLARIYRQGKRFPDAVRELKAGLAATPQDARLHAEAGFLLLDSGRPADAVPRFRTALRYDEKSPAAWGGLVRALRETGRTEQADRVLGAAPAEVRALLQRTMPASPAAVPGSPIAAPDSSAALGLP
jgi:tetratricopeptide (TPR) repeat protein